MVRRGVFEKIGSLFLEEIELKRVRALFKIKQKNGIHQRIKIKHIFFLHHYGISQDTYNFKTVFQS